MFREISRSTKQILTEQECERILEKATSGVLSVLGDDGYPYGVPMSYSYKEGKLYFHCMPRGHKFDAVRNYEKVSFTVIETDQVVPEEFTTYFRSVIVFGKVRIEEDPQKKREALMYLVEKYSADFMEGAHKEIESKLEAAGVFVVEAEHISGKEAIEFAENRK